MEAKKSTQEQTRVASWVGKAILGAKTLRRTKGRNQQAKMMVTLSKLGISSKAVMTHAFNPSTQRAKAGVVMDGNLWVQSQPAHQSKFSSTS